jgi:hypothetical protein
VKRVVLLLTLMLLVITGLAFAGDDDNHGYFGYTAEPGFYNILGSVPTPGTYVTIVSIPNVGKGSYLVFYKLVGGSYEQNSGALCNLFGPAASTIVDPGAILNTSSPDGNLTNVTAVVMGTLVSTAKGTVTLQCIRGYSFTGDSLMGGTLTLQEVTKLN